MQLVGVAGEKDVKFLIFPVLAMAFSEIYTIFKIKLIFLYIGRFEFKP